MKPTILTVIQDRVNRANLTYALASHGFDVVESQDLHSVTDQIRRQFAEIVVTSLNESPALELCRRIRQHSDIPIIVQLLQHSERSEWMCFQAGADDVVDAHISRRVLLARVQSLLNRHSTAPPNRVRTLRAGQLLVDLDARTLHIDDRPVELTRTEFDLLAQLMAQPRRVHIRGDLVYAVWGVHCSDHLLETHLSRLRKKVRTAGGPEIGIAVRGIGYRLGINAATQTTLP